MAGFEQVMITVPPIASGGSPSFEGMKHGPSRKMTADANTSISAVAVLCVPAPDKMLLQIFHNRYAAIPLDQALLTAPEVMQWVLRENANGTTDFQEV